MRTDFKGVYDLFKKADNVAIVGHIRPDGDCIGSAMAIRYALLQRGASVVDVFFDDLIPINFFYLPDFEQIKDKNYIDKNPWREYDLLIVVDSSTEDRIGRCTELRKHAKKVLVIDHHQNTTMEGDVVVVNPKHVAIGAILYEFFVDTNIEITKDVATALYTSMATDTGCFAQANTTGYAHRAAATLIDKGIDIETINYNNFRLYDRRVIPGLAYALRNIKFFSHGSVALIGIPYSKIKKFGLNGELNQFKKFASEASGVRVGMIITERKKGEFNVSLRSHGNVDVAKIAESFGGGGHKNASGFVMKGKYQKVLKDILNQVEKCLIMTES